MKLRQIRIHVAVAVITALSIATVCDSNDVRAEELQLGLQNGSIVTADVRNGSFAWTDVSENGEMSKRQIEFSTLRHLILSSATASDQVAEIRRLLNDLRGSDYLRRQAAEIKLSDPEIGGKFKSILALESKHQSLEVRHRMGRILDRLDSVNHASTTNEFDQLTLKDGTRLEGDAGELSLKCLYRNRPMNLSRKDIRLISVPMKVSQANPINADVQVRMFHQHKGEFYLPGQTTVDFQLAPNDAEIPRNANVNDMFTSQGLRLGTPVAGYIGISGYGFKFNLPPNGNSICVFESVGTFSKRFKGVMEVRFCVPNQANVPAGVKEFGLFLARVNHSRDFIVEAYNSEGEILAAVEATDQPCIFAGVKSNELITKLRILSNPYLFRTDRAIDEDYAVDSICFSTPVPISNTTNVNNKASLRLTNGDVLQGDSISVSDSGNISIDIPNFESTQVTRDELAAIQFDRPNSKPGAEQWTASLNDRSVLFVEPGKTFTSKTFPHLNFNLTELTGLWTSSNPARFPEAKDFEKGKSILVFPTCRIATDSLEVSGKGYQWNESAIKIQQPIHLDGDPDDSDPTPKNTSVDFGDPQPSNTPTLWMNRPKTAPAGAGRIRLVDGQQLTLGTRSGFQLTKLNKNSASVSVGGRETNIPLDEILSIEFPQNNTPND